MNQPAEIAPIEKIKSLRPERIAEVEGFIDLLKALATNAGSRRPQDRSRRIHSGRYGTTRTTPTMTGCEFGDIVLVPFPFTDQSASKKRPALVSQMLDGVLAGKSH